MADRRPDPTNPPGTKKTYTRDQFYDFYGPGYGKKMWRQAGQQLKKQVEATPVKITYWAGRGRCEPLRMIIAAGGGKMDNVFMSKKDPKEMEELRATGKLAYGQVPLVEVDGLNLVQGYATAQYLGQKYGLHPTSAKEQYLCAHVWAAVQDARQPLLMFPFAPGGDVAKAKAACAVTKMGEAPGLFSRYAPAWERMLGETKGAFFLKRGATIADIAVFEIFDFYQWVCGEEALAEALKPFPKIVAMREAVLKVGGLAKWVGEERGPLYLPWDEYAACVRGTLQF